MISVVCVVNNRSTLETYLLKSLKDQIADYELTIVDNTRGQFSSASEALNYGGSKATSKYVMFAHQDVYLPSPNWLDEAETYLNSIHDLGIAGVAGMIEGGYSNEERGRNIIKHGDPLEVWTWGHPIAKPEPVQTLDECLVLIPKKVFDIHSFDEVTCDGWDLYAVDYSLSIRRVGLGVFVLPLMIHHRSNGHITKSYYVTLSKVLKKHRNNCRRINTTVDSWNTLIPLSMQRSIKSVRKKSRRAMNKASSLFKGHARL
jgi:hypothetical protein